MAKAKKLASGNWRILVYDYTDPITGKRHYQSFTAETKKEAEYMGAEFALKKNRKPLDITVGEAVDRYINSKCFTLSPSTVRGYKTARKSMKGLENIRLRDVTEIALQEWANRNAREYSPKSIKNQYGLICAALRQSKINLDFQTILLKPKQKVEYIVPDEKEMGEIVKIVKGTNVEIPVLFALLLGLRQSEIAALTWADYDGEKIDIHGAIVPDENHKLIYKDTNKSYAGRRVLDVPDYLRSKLNELKEQLSPKEDDRISPMVSSSITRAFHRVCKANGLPEFKMHNLRHANASLMLMKGVADKYAMERLGQSTPSMLKNVYQHTFKSEHKKVSEKMNNVFDEICTA